MGELGIFMTSPSLVDWCSASRVYPGQVESGDRPVYAPYATGVLLGVVDGLGHGEEAAAVARTAVETLERHRTEPVSSLVVRCHSALEGTRGVVMSLAAFSAREPTLSWIGVGNVEAVLLRADAAANPSFETLLLRGGVVGYQLPLLDAAIIPVSPGDTLILATDGVRSDFVSSLARGTPSRQLADLILDHHGREDDDALVLVARFLGWKA